MDSDVENQVWQRAWQVYGNSLHVILREALPSYKRTAGFDDITRLYDRTVGEQVIPFLRQELKLRSPNGSAESSVSFIEIRVRLRLYLQAYLLRRIVLDHK